MQKGYLVGDPSDAPKVSLEWQNAAKHLMTSDYLKKMTHFISVLIMRLHDRKVLYKVSDGTLLFTVITYYDFMYLFQNNGKNQYI